MEKKAGPKAAARALAMAFRDLHDSVRRVGLSEMSISETAASFELEDRTQAAHERLKRHIAIEEMKPRMAAFSATLAEHLPGRDLELELGWDSGVRPDYILMIAGRNVLDGGKAVIEKALLGFFEASASSTGAGAAPRARRAVIGRIHQNWASQAREGHPLIGKLTRGYTGIDLWNDVSEAEARVLFEHKRASSRNAEAIGPILATGVATGPGTVLCGDVAMPGYVAASSPVFERISSAAARGQDQEARRVRLEHGLKEELLEIHGARAVQSVAISLQRRPGAAQSWSFSSCEIEGGTSSKQAAIRAAAMIVCEHLEDAIKDLGACDLFGGLVKIEGHRRGRKPIDEVSLTCRIGGVKMELEMDWLGIVKGRYPQAPIWQALKTWQAEIAVSAELAKDGTPGLYVAIHNSGISQSAVPYWAASPLHAAWLEMQTHLGSGFIAQGGLEIAGYPLELSFEPLEPLAEGD